MAKRYIIKCDDRKEKIGETDNLGESAAGGRCEECWHQMRADTRKAEAAIAKAAGRE